ncbi:MAG: hypothetical protein KY443_00645 [Actinobacteria bacterium]|nr:hypothetical protein [Actinomycetota bacterium]
MHATEVRGDRRVRLSALATAFLFVFSALGLVTHDAGDPDAELVAGAAEATARTGAAKVSFTVEVEADAATFTTRGDGVVDLAGNRAALAITVADREPVDVVLVGDQAYHHVGPGAPKPWIAMPPPPMTAPFLGAAGPGGHALAALALLEDADALRGMRRAGVDEVGGVRTDKYVGSLDADVMGTGAEAPAGGRPLQALRFLPSSLEVWVSDDGLIRRYRTVVVASVDETAFRMHVSVELDEFGVPVRIEAPPADEVQQPAA